MTKEQREQVVRLIDAYGEAERYVGEALFGDGYTESERREAVAASASARAALVDYLNALTEEA